ncbi:TPA: hypothetical protein ACUU9L_004543 [Yersinia enterocolitica]|uniref:hypothetical protein n=1 Tax=Yersinia enterocolitica TaxID=630 RepID=UPI002A58C16A|nr:hypothetical protein [Yersinia enterocolitica]HDL7937218.1 hypothetical protein [Yersinia enterocolitica]
MTDEIKTGGPAFPFIPGEGSALYESEGMQLRDYFAAKAMQGIIRRWDGHGFGGGPNSPEYKELADSAYLIADAMIKARG